MADSSEDTGNAARHIGGAEDHEVIGHPTAKTDTAAFISQSLRRTAIYGDKIDLLRTIIAGHARDPVAIWGYLR